MKQRRVNLGAGGQKRKKGPNKQTMEVNANEQRSSLQLRLSKPLRNSIKLDYVSVTDITAKLNSNNTVV